MKETALVIMAAGIGSRFGGGIKQLAPVGPNGEIIMGLICKKAFSDDLAGIGDQHKCSRLYTFNIVAEL